MLNDSFPPKIDGVANAVLNYAKILSKTDQVTVITPYYPRVEDHYDFAVKRYFSLPGSKRLGYRVGNPFAVENARYVLRRHPFDVIHMHSPFASGLLSRMIHKKDCVLIATYHTKFEYDIEKRVKNKLMRRVARHFILSNLNACDEVWAVSEGAGESLRTIGYEGPYHVMPNGTDFPAGRAPENEIRALELQLGLAPEETLLLFVGRMMWYKNTRLIIDACKIAREAGFRFRMVLFGDGHDRQEMIEYVKQIGMSDWIQFPGAIYDRAKLYACYSRAYAFLFPSSYDTSGLVVKEAAACGCPSVLLRGSCAAEGVEDGFSGYLSETEDARGVADKLMEALADPQRNRQIGAQAQQHVYLSWEDAVQRASERYDLLLEQKSAERTGRRKGKAD